jgi:hypothetical protein
MQCLKRLHLTPPPQKANTATRFLLVHIEGLFCNTACHTIIGGFFFASTQFQVSK